MLRPTVPGKVKSPRSAVNSPDPASAELKFVADLGRSLLFTVHPKKVASKVADAVRFSSGCDTCVFVAEIGNMGLVTSAFNAHGEIENSLLNRERFVRWLDLLPPQIGYPAKTEDEFLLTSQHEFEYISPLHINGQVRGAIIAAFTSENEFAERTQRIIDASTQIAAMSINLTAHYESTIDTSITKAREEHRKFTEAILDSLPVSLYVVDRDYRIVTWNRHREDGLQGIPRDTVIGKDVFEVLARYPQGRLRDEFERAFATGRIERRRAGGRL